MADGFDFATDMVGDFNLTSPAPDLGLAGAASDFSLDVPLTPDPASAFAIQAMPSGADISAAAVPDVAPAPAPPPPKPGFFSDLGSGLRKEFTTSPLAVLAQSLGLAGTGLSLASLPALQRSVGKQTDVAGRAEKFAESTAGRASTLAESAARPATEFGTDVLGRAKSGQLDPAFQAMIDDWAQKKKADARALFAQLGLGTSTDLETYLDEIDRLALGMRGEMLQGQESVGLEALQIGVGGAGAISGAGQTAATAGNIAQNQQALLANLIQSANGQLAMLGAKT